MLLELLILITIALYLFWYWATKNNDFFKKRGIPYAKPFPLFGNFRDVILKRQNVFDHGIELYNMHDGKVYGVFDQREPTYLIRDVELLKLITVKDFDHFVNHPSPFGESDSGGLIDSSVLMLKDAKWKDMRSTLSPVFTGSKLRQMFQLINQAAAEAVTYLKQSNLNDGDGIELDVKDFSTRFANDVIASAAFGLQINSFDNKNNEFYEMGKKVTNFTAWQVFKAFLHIHFKPLSKLLGLEVFDQRLNNYFTRLVIDAMEYRKKNNIFRPDMINMLMEARGMIESENPKSHNREWTDKEIVAQCFIFFFAGFETVSTMLCFILHELMENRDVQKRLEEEIEEVANNLDGKPLTYEALSGMKYLDMVVSEALRKWPIVIELDRICSKDYVFEENGKQFVIEKGSKILIPMSGYHRDPKYFENPNQFDPERFSDENKNNINPIAYMPFGLGPRNCIGSRFALLEMKALLYYFVHAFRIEASKETCLPIKLSGIGLQLAPKNGWWLKIVPKTKTT